MKKINRIAMVCSVILCSAVLPFNTLQVNADPDLSKYGLDVTLNNYNEPLCSVMLYSPRTGEIKIIDKGSFNHGPGCSNQKLWLFSISKNGTYIKEHTLAEDHVGVEDVPYTEYYIDTQKTDEEHYDKAITDFIDSSSFRQVDLNVGMTEINRNAIYHLPETETIYSEDKYLPDYSVMTQVTIAEGEEKILSPKLELIDDSLLIRWSSSDPQTASVDNSGKLIGKGEGTCQVTATADGLDHELVSYTVTVKSLQKDIKDKAVAFAFQKIGRSSDKYYSVVDFDNDGTQELLICTDELTVYEYDRSSETFQECASIEINEINGAFSYSACWMKDGSLYLGNTMASSYSFPKQGQQSEDTLIYKYNGNNFEYIVGLWHRDYHQIDPTISERAFVINKDDKKGVSEKDFISYVHDLLGIKPAEGFGFAFRNGNVPFFAGNADCREDFVLPYSDCTYLTQEDLKNMSKDELELAIQEMYARYGYTFSSEKYKEYFSSKSWYTAKGIAADEIWFNRYEDANLKTLGAASAAKS